MSRRYLFFFFLVCAHDLVLSLVFSVRRSRRVFDPSVSCLLRDFVTSYVLLKAAMLFKAADAGSSADGAVCLHCVWPSTWPILPSFIPR